MIEFKNVVKQFKNKNNILRAVDSVSFTIEQGSIFGVIGQSGAGKSTLLRMINQLEVQDEGDIIVDGKYIKNLSREELRYFRMQCPMVFQHFNLLWSRTVFENVMLPLEIRGKQKGDEKKVRSILELVGLSDKALEHPSKLSGGQKQRVGIARALVMDPKIILCDEATSALDPETTIKILKLLKKINKELGITIVLITHEMDVVKEICDYTMIMKDGVIESLGTTINVFKENNPLIKESSNAKYQANANEKIITLTFEDESISNHTLYQLITQFNLRPNIIEASIKEVNDHEIGYLIIKIEKSFDLTEIKHYLKKLSIGIEVIG
jgi:D-methionine transport system ATP-binding protein